MAIAFKNHLLQLDLSSYCVISALCSATGFLAAAQEQGMAVLMLNAAGPQLLQALRLLTEAYVCAQAVLFNQCAMYVAAAPIYLPFRCAVALVSLVFKDTAL